MVHKAPSFLFVLKTDLTGTTLAPHDSNSTYHQNTSSLRINALVQRHTNNISLPPAKLLSVYFDNPCHYLPALISVQLDYDFYILLEPFLVKLNNFIDDEDVRAIRGNILDDLLRVVVKVQLAREFDV